MTTNYDPFLREISKLSEELDQHEGQQVYVLVMKENPVRTMPPRPFFTASDITIKTSRYVGILGRPPIVKYHPNSFMFEIKTTKHVYADNYYPDWNLEKDSIILESYMIMYRDEKLPIRDSNTFLKNDENLSKELGGTLKIVVGENNIAQQIDKEEVPWYHRITLLDWAWALHILDLSIPKPIVKKFEDDKRKKYREIVSRLWKLSRADQKIEARIKDIYESVGRTITDKDGGIISLEDKDDAHVISLGSYMESEITERDMRILLEKAVRLKMHKSDMILDFYVPGAKIFVRDFIQNMCKEYKIKLTE